MAKYRKLEGAARIKAFLLLKAGMNESATARACGASRDAVRRFHRSERFRRMDSGADMEALHAECKALRQENGFLIRALERAADQMDRLQSGRGFYDKTKINLHSI